MEEALERSQEDHASDLKVSFLLDYTRGSRGLFLSLSHTSPFHTTIPVNYHKTSRLSWYDFSIKKYAVLATEQQN